MAPDGVSTCRSENAKGEEWFEKVFDYVIACNSLKRKISQMEVVEDLSQDDTRREGDKGMESCRRCYLVEVEKGLP